MWTNYKNRHLFQNIHIYLKFIYIQIADYQLNKFYDFLF